MGSLSRVHGQNLLDGSLAVAAFVASTAPIRCRLMTTNGSETANGTELTTGGGYTSGASAPSVTFGATNASGVSASTTAVTVTNMPAPAGGSIVGVELWDSAGTPVRKHWGALTASKAVASGDTFSIASGSLTVTLT